MPRPRRSLRRLSLLRSIPPGSQFYYSNTGYTLLAVVIQRASGKSYEDFVRECILKPVKMDATRMDSRPDVITGRASGYYGSRSRGTLYNAEYYSPQQYLGSGSLLSSAKDLVKWNLALHNGKLFADTKTNLYAARFFDFGWGKAGTKEHRSVWSGDGL